MDEFEKMMIDEDKNFVDFKATTGRLAIRKFMRLNRINPGPWNNAQNILDAGRDLKNDEEYTVFLEWLGNPQGVKIENPVQNSTTCLDKSGYEDELIKFSVKQETNGDIMTIHVVNEDWNKKDQLDSDDEKVC